MSYNPERWFKEVGAHTLFIVALLIIAYTVTYAAVFRQCIKDWRRNN